MSKSWLRCCFQRRAARLISRRSVALLATLASAASVVLMSSSASAVTTVTLTKDLTIAAPPSSTFTGASSGDGWDVQFYGSEIFNVFHHNSGAYQVDCHLQSDGSHCSADWPKTITDGATVFTTPGHSTGWVDTTTGDFYGWTTRASDKTGGVLCVDLASSSTNPFCGFTPLTRANEAAIPMGSGVDGGALVGNKMYAVNAASGSAVNGALLCFDTVTKTACDGQPYQQLGLSTISSSVYDWTAVAGGLVFTTTDGGILTCFDPAKGTICAGNWPVKSAPANQAKPFPMLDASANQVGICIPQPNVVPCWNFDGTAATTPSALKTAIAAGGSWESSAVVGSRVFVAGSNSVVYCYDFGAGAACPNFPKSIVGSSLLYTVNPDPQRFGCIWTNADGGTSQIQNFDAFTGESGCDGTVRLSASVLVPNLECVPVSWSSMQILDPAAPPTGYDSATVSLTDNGGTAIAGGSGLAVDGTGTVDLSALDPPIDGTMPVFGIDFTNPTFNASGVVLRFSWTSPDDLACTADKPDAPTGATVTSTGNRQATVSWTAPASDGGAPITQYTVIASPGGATCTATPPATSCTVPGLTNGGTYAFRVTATNAAGTSDPSAASASTTLAVGVPDPPAAPTVTPGSTSIDVSWLPPADGGSAITGYTATASPDGATCTATPPATNCTLTGLTKGTAYTVTVTATNGEGTSDASNVSRSATPGDPPSAPAAPTAVAGNGSATVSWTAPAPGTSAILSYRVTASPGGATCVATAPDTSCVVSGLTNGTVYTFAVTATNASGTSGASPASSSIKPSPTSADLGITLSGPTAVYVNATVKYTITVTNAGPDAAASVTVSDTLPVAAKSAATTTTGCAIATGTLTCSIASLPASASTSIVVTAIATDKLVNQATVSSATPDPNTADNTSATLTTSVSSPPTLPAPPSNSTDSDSAEGSDPSGTVTVASGPLTVDGSGAGGLTIATLDGGPAGAPDRSSTAALGGDNFGGFYSVRLESGSGFSGTTLRLHGTPSSSLFWWDGTAWQKVPGVTRDAATGDLTVTLTNATTPSISDLSDAVFAGGATPVTRLGGATRIGTAVAVSQRDFPTAGSADAAVVARDDVFADALTGGPLAAARNAPMLVTGSTVLLPDVRDELKRLLLPGSTVYVLGGTAAISDGVANAIASLGFHVQRIAGSDRYATAVAIANALGNPSTVFEASGTSFADALSAGPAAIDAGGVVLLTGDGSQSAPTAAYLAAHAGAARFAIGGHASRADGAATGLVGADRYQTAAMVAGRFFGSPDSAGLATGENFVDSMVAVPSLGRVHAPLLLVPASGNLPTAVTGYLQAHASTIVSATTFGGTKAVSDKAIAQLQTATP